MLSLHRFKLYKFAQILAEGTADEATLIDAQAQYDALLGMDPRSVAPAQSPEVSPSGRVA